MFHALQLSFNAGELSPYLAARTDLPKYMTGCQRLENFLITPYGGIIRRPGTQYLGKAARMDKRSRLIGFNFSVSTNFIIEFCDLGVRFWTNGAQIVVPAAQAPAWATATAYVVGNFVTQASVKYYCIVAHTSGTFAADLAAGKWRQQDALELSSPYTEEQLRAIQYVQINDIMYLVHPSHPEHKLTRKADDNWTLEKLKFKWPALMPENVTAVTIAPSATTGNITLTASADLFVATDVGAVWQIGHNIAGKAATYVEVPLNATSSTSALLRVRGPWTFNTYGSWKGEVRIRRKTLSNNVTETIRAYSNNVEGQRNVSTAGTEDANCDMSIQWIAAGSAGTNAPSARLEFSNSKIFGLVQITAFTDPQHVNATVTWELERTEATIYWSKAAFSATNGFARTICVHESRLILGGCFKRPLSLYGSRIDDFEDFTLGSNADDGFAFTLASTESNPICWIVSQSRMLVGTAGEEWAIGAPDNSEQAMGPGNVQAKRQSRFGSAYIQARLVNETLLFCQRQARKIREFSYSYERDGWVSPDLTLLASHIAGVNGFVETGFAAQPDSVFWGITAAGQLVGMTYERDQNVIGWHRHTTQGEFESVATIYGDAPLADEVWFCVRRVVNGQTVRYIERFDPTHGPNLEEEDKANYWYLDCAKRHIAPGVDKVTLIPGLEHLEGLEVDVLGDGANQPERVVTGGQITIQEPAHRVLAGLEYESVSMPMPVILPTENGTSIGRKIRIHRGIARLYKSLCAEFSTDGGASWDEIYFRGRTSLMDNSPSIFTGDKDFATGANARTITQVAVRQTRPFPLVLLALVIQADFYGQ